MRVQSTLFLFFYLSLTLSFQAEGKLLPENLTDESGEQLTGKRAAIQFAYQVNSQPDVKKNNEEASKDDLERLAEILDAKDTDTEDVAERKKQLLKKIGEFGHFATTKVDKQDVQDKEAAKAEEDIEKKDKTKKTRSSSSRQSLNKDPLRSPDNAVASGGSSDKSGAAAAAERIIGLEDDPFRFVQN